MDLKRILPFIIDEIPMGIVAIDVERRIVLVNRAMEALTGFDRNTAGNIACHHIIRGDFCLGKCPVLSKEHGPEIICLEGNIINRERRNIPVRVTFTPIRDSLGEVKGFFETFEDIRLLSVLAGKTSEAYSFGSLVGHSPQMEEENKRNGFSYRRLAGSVEPSR